MIGYLPKESPKFSQLIGLAIQNLLTSLPATLVVSLLTGLNLSVLLFFSGVGTIVAILLTKREIPLFYSGSFSYITVIASAMASFAARGFTYDQSFSFIAVGTFFTALAQIVVGFIMKKAGYEKINKIFPPYIMGSIIIIIGLLLAESAVGQASSNWLISSVTLLIILAWQIVFKEKVISLFPVIAGVAGGIILSFFFGQISLMKVNETSWFAMPHFVLPNFLAPQSYEYSFALAALALATIVESVGHLNQIGVYTNKLARDKQVEEPHIERKTGLNLIADGTADLVSSLGGCVPMTNYGESISICNITRCYSTKVIAASALLSILFSFCNKIPAFVSIIPQAVIGGMSVYMFGLISMQGLTLMSEAKTDFFNPRIMAVVGVMLILGMSKITITLGIIVLPSVVVATIAGLIIDNLWAHYYG